MAEPTFDPSAGSNHVAARSHQRPSRIVVPDGLGRLQGVLSRVLGWAFRWHARLRVCGAGYVPRSGHVIIAANHRSMLDIPLLVLASPRRVHFMAKSILFDKRIQGWLFHELGGFPVNRDRADLRALEIATAILERGDVVGIYPEGTRSKSGEMLPFLGGAAWLALRAGVPIVPCGIVGTRAPSTTSPNEVPGEPGFLRSLRRRRVTIRFGPPIPVEAVRGARARREQLPLLTDRIMTAIDELAQP